MRMLLIDALNLAHRNYHAMNLRTSEGVPTGMTFGCMNSLLFAQSQARADKVVTLWDEPTSKLRRRAIYPGYKAHRDSIERAPDFDEQLNTVQALYETLGLGHVSSSDFEADDLMEAITLDSLSDEFVVFTNDMDLMQLVSEDGRIKVLHPKHGMMGWQEVTKHLGVRPNQVADFKAIVGDSSDEYKGAPGIGPKTAQLLFLVNDGLDGLFTNPVTLKLGHLPGRAGATLLQHKEEIAMCRQLALLHGKEALEAGCTVDFAPKNLDWVRSKFEELEFQSLLQRWHEFEALP